jgi:O-antigen/teichoic acid export membrane protein
VPALTRQALVVATARLVNQGLMVISPLVLVRLLTVEDFGEYREFLLYATVIGNFAAFSFPNSLMYFVGLQPAAAWGYTKRVAAAVFMSSVLAVTAFAAFEWVGNHSLLGDALLPCLLYVLFYANLDFWECLWLAQRKATAVFLYTAGRLAARLGVVIVVATVSRSVEYVVWALVILEGVRLLLSAVFFRVATQRDVGEPPNVSWRGMMEFCLPAGTSVFVTTLSSSLSGILIDHQLGSEELAKFVVGSYIFMVIFPIRNALSDVLLSEMAKQEAVRRNGWLPLWNRSTVILAIMLVPISILMARYSGAVIEVIFSASYLEAVPVMRAFAFLIALCCVDLALIMRVTSQTRVMLKATMVSSAINLVGLFFLLPGHGIGGAAIATVMASLAGLVYGANTLAGSQGLRLADLFPLTAIGKIALASALASVLLLPSLAVSGSGLSSVILSAIGFMFVYLAALAVMRLEEFYWLLGALFSRRGVRALSEDRG